MSSRSKAAFIGIDAGTTGTTVGIYDEQGEELATGYREYPCTYPHTNWVEQDLETVWQAICEASAEAIVAADLPGDAYKSVGLSSQRGTFGLLDAEKKPLAASIVWNDGRAKAYEAIFGQVMPPEAFQDHTGMQLSSAWAALKIAWVRDKQPELFAKTRWIVNGQEFFLHRLGAEEWGTDPASLTMNAMMDIRKLDWSDRVLSLCGITRDLLPPVGRTAAQVGRVSKTAAQLTGIPEGTPICRGAGDQQCAAVGAGVIRQGMAEFTIGTAAVMVAHLDSPDWATGRDLFVGGHGVPDMWDLEGAAFATGSCLRWWRDMLGKNEIEVSSERGCSPYSVMVECAAKSPAGAHGLFFHPFLQGQVTPYYDVAAKGGFLGLGQNHDRSDLLRAVLEGCANELRMVVDTFQRGLKGGVEELRLTGGGTKSLGFIEIMANVIGMPVSVLTVRECTVLGAAILGAVGAGHFASVADAVSSMVKLERDVDPDPSLKGLYEDQHGLFRDAYEAWRDKGIYQRMYSYNEKYF